VDIQPIAIQITKLRFFISLVCDQKTNRNKKDNHGIRPLPNLETKFVAADTLIGLPEMTQPLLVDRRVGVIEKEIESLYHSHFSEQNRTKKLANQRKVKTLRQDLAKLLAESLMSPAKSKHVAEWDPFDPQSSADFFDPHWMFGRSLTKGFDVVIGNPPYVRIQMLAQADPKQPARLKEQYTSASKGNYDLYAVFVERGLQLLQPHGQLSYILPHKFFNAQYGEPLRKLLADGRNLRQVVHFGDEQIFPGATNYVCLLFLDRGGAEHCRWVRADDLPAWLADKTATETVIASTRFTKAEWNFAIGKGASLFERLQRLPVKLDDVTARIFQGLVTGADGVFILHKRPSSLLFSEATGQEHEIEAELLHPLLKGALDIRRYYTEQPTRWILFPYVVIAGRAELIPEAQFKNKYPKAWRYLLENRQRLEAREGGKWNHERWYALGRSQNLNEMEQKKILTPCIASKASFTFDNTSEMYFIGSGAGGGGGYGITLKPSAVINPLYVLALLNSALLDFILKQVSSTFRGGYFAYSRQFIDQLPIHLINFAVATERAHHDAIVSLVDRILGAKQANAAADTSALEHEIDQLVYALYDLTPEDIAIIESPAK